MATIISEKQIKLNNNKALKEWAVIVKMLTEGKQILVARKGGIVEVDNRFEVQEKEFFLYPTFEHQQIDAILPQYQPDLMDTMNEKPSDRRLSLPGYAVVEDIYKIHDLTKLEALQDYYIWTHDSIAMRFNWNKDRILYLLTLRVYKLPQIHTLPWNDSYSGCTSWVTLAEELSTTGAKPVLSDEEFGKQAEKIRCTLA